MFHINVRRNALRYTARWKVDHISLTVPYGETPEHVMEAIEAMLPRLVARRPTASYSLGQVIEIDGLHIEIVPSTKQSGYVRSNPTPSGGTVEVDSNIDITSASATRLISKMLAYTARAFTLSTIIPRAKEICQILKLEPRAIELSRGLKVMGNCTARGVIHISSACAFLTSDLRDYIICHELSHRVHFNHSPEFHALCTRYMQSIGYSATSRQMQRKLNEYQSPLLK